MNRAPSKHATDARKAGFVRNDDGSILVFWALFLAVAFGFAALIFDLGRVASTQTELQSFADQVALAAAGELDGRPGARSRAATAADQLIGRAQTFGEGPRRLAGADAYTLSLLRSPDGPEADSDGAARFARVVVNMTTVWTPFAAVNASLVGRPGENASSVVSAVAVAGRTTFACDITPLFFCLPNADWRATANIGHQIAMVSGSSGNSAWGPGNFGFLDPTVLEVDPSGACANRDGQLLTGANLYRCLVGAERGITQCIETTRPLETRPGQAQGLTNAFNTRFDIYQGAMSSFRTDLNYRPAPNVLWHGAPGATSPEPNLPRDSCIAADTCQFGTGDWDREGYLASFHNGQWPINGDPRPADEIPLRGRATRHDIYMAEIASARARGDAGMLTADGYDTLGRPGNHAFAQNATLRAALDTARRTVVAAAVDCSDASMNGRANVFPMEYVRLFFTEAVQGSGSDARILAEVVGTAGGLGSGAGTASFHEIIQLVR
jgi:hypothetical protein